MEVEVVGLSLPGFHSTHDTSAALSSHMNALPGAL